MIFKTIFMLALFLIPMVIINTGIISEPWFLFAMYLMSGFGMAGIGMGIMHDAIHGAYSKNRAINKYMGYTMNLIGANATVWKIQHNVLHHTYTNITEADEDINTPFFLRFSPHIKRNWLHQFQYIYVWIFYGLSTISWVTIKDFIQINRYRKMGFFDRKNSFRKELLSLTGWKMVYYAYALILPVIMVPLPSWMVILAFISMHFITGLCISIVFQAAHVMPDTSFPQPDKDGLIDNNWTIHQLATTTNFAPKSRFFSWLIGGLNYQVEHHLLPNICHIHYRKISHIIEKTAKEYGAPYHFKKSFVAAICDHIRMLKQLGKADIASTK